MFIEENRTVTELVVDQSAVDSVEFRLQCKKEENSVWMTEERLSSKNKKHQFLF